MTPLTAKDILPLDSFLAQRQKIYSQVSASKAARRLNIGGAFSLHFENRDTMSWQVHEMCRVERLLTAEAIQGELDAYNPLIPGASELSATLLIQYEDEAERREMLVKLSGIDKHLRLEIQGADAVRAQFEEGREREESGKVSSVQFVRFAFNEAQLAAFMDLGRRARLVVDHPSYAAETTLTAAQRGALIDDLNTP